MFTAHISQTSPVCLYIRLTDFSLLQNSPSFLLHHVTVSESVNHEQTEEKNQHILKKIVTTKMNFYTQIQNIVSSLSSTRSIFYFISSHFLLLRESGKDSYSCAFVSQSLYWWDAFSEIIISSSTDQSTIQRRHWLIQLHIHMKATKVNTRKQSNSLTYKHADSSKTWSCPIFYLKSNTLTERKDKEAPPVGLWWKQTIFLLLIIFWIFI